MRLINKVRFGSLAGTGVAMLALAANAVGVSAAGASGVVAFVGQANVLTCSDASTGTTSIVDGLPGTGQSGTLTPVWQLPQLNTPNPVPPNIAPGVISCSSSSGTGVPWVGGYGNFSFFADANPVVGLTPSWCIFQVSAPPPSASVGCQINASGSYSNIVCGTGTATGSATLTANPPAIEGVGASVDVTVNFDILFVGGVGVVTGATSAGTLGVVAGVVVLTPLGSSVPPPAGSCVSSFTVVGVTAIV